jgi:hypothetical protein
MAGKLTTLLHTCAASALLNDAPPHAAAAPIKAVFSLVVHASRVELFAFLQPLQTLCLDDDDGAYNSENAYSQGIVDEFNATTSASTREHLGESGMQKALLQGVWSYSFRAAAMTSAKLGGAMTNNPESTV